MKQRSFSFDLDEEEKWRHLSIEMNDEFSRFSQRIPIRKNLNCRRDGRKSTKKFEEKKTRFIERRSFSASRFTKKSETRKKGNFWRREKFRTSFGRFFCSIRFCSWLFSDRFRAKTKENDSNFWWKKEKFSNISLIDRSSTKKISIRVETKKILFDSTKILFVKTKIKFVFPLIWFFRFSSRHRGRANAWLSNRRFKLADFFTWKRNQRNSRRWNGESNKDRSSFFLFYFSRAKSYLSLDKTKPTVPLEDFTKSIDFEPEIKRDSSIQELF